MVGRTELELQQEPADQAPPMEYIYIVAAVQHLRVLIICHCILNKASNVWPVMRKWKGV